jgi:hypothetical protein
MRSMRREGAGLWMRRWTKMPGVWIWSGSSSPGDDDLGFGDGDFAAHGGAGVEVARGAAVDEVAVGVGLPGFDEGDVGADAALEDVG